MIQLSPAKLLHRLNEKGGIQKIIEERFVGVEPPKKFRF